MTSRIRFILFPTSSNFKMATDFVFLEGIRTGQEEDWNWGKEHHDSWPCPLGEPTV